MKRIFCLLLIIEILGGGATAQAQQPGKIPWIGYLARSGSGPSPAFLQGLRDLGYVERKNIGFVFRTAEGRSERYADLAAELVRLKVEANVHYVQLVQPLDLKTDNHEEFLICRNVAGEMLTIRLDRIRSMKPV